MFSGRFRWAPLTFNNSTDSFWSNLCHSLKALDKHMTICYAACTHTLRTQKHFPQGGIRELCRQSTKGNGGWNKTAVKEHDWCCTWQAGLRDKQATPQIHPPSSTRTHTHTSTSSYQDGFLIRENTLLELPSFIHKHTILTLKIKLRKRKGIDIILTPIGKTQMVYVFVWHVIASGICLTTAS